MTTDTCEADLAPPATSAPTAPTCEPVTVTEQRIGVSRYARIKGQSWNMDVLVDTHMPIGNSLREEAAKLRQQAAAALKRAERMESAAVAADQPREARR